MIHVPYTSQLFEEDGQIVALCPELNVSSFGHTPEEALTSLQEAVTLFLEECQQLGTLEIILEEAGYHRESPSSPKWIPRQPIEVHQLEVSFA
ncbi:MAG: type II toxin-antitoxin system HicB family antitoxin [Chloroflexi bacterium]|nr:type II toxin-antitoxin system HicB family antitoxin [Chloroflexota bacterium]